MRCRRGRALCFDGDGLKNASSSESSDSSRAGGGEARDVFSALEQRDDDQPEVPANQGGNRRQQRRMQQMDLARALRGHGAQGGRSGGLVAAALRRNLFIQGKEEWLHRNFGLFYQVLWLFPVVGESLYLNVRL